jgi:hypothetical protein
MNHPSKEVRKRLQEWSVDNLCWKIGKEMDGVKQSLKLHSDEVTPEFLDSWSFSDNVQARAITHAPCLRRILLSAAQTDPAAAENTMKCGSKSLYILFISLM